MTDPEQFFMAKKQLVAALDTIPRRNSPGSDELLDNLGYVGYFQLPQRTLQFTIRKITSKPLPAGEACGPSIQTRPLVQFRSG
jgi:hypothetical protein